MSAVVPRLANFDRMTISVRNVLHRTAQNINERPASARATEARGSLLPGLAMDCSLRDSLQGLGGVLADLYQPYELASFFPLGDGHLTTGSPTAYLQLSESSIAISHLQLAVDLAFNISLRLVENSNRRAALQPIRAVGKPSFLWESASRLHAYWRFINSAW